jgi:putative flavoprotein involved in K+ transport
VRTDQGEWLCRAVVVASGACNIADVPTFANRVPRSIMQLTAQEYRNPEQLADGGILVVGELVEAIPKFACQARSSSSSALASFKSSVSKPSVNQP